VLLLSKILNHFSYSSEVAVSFVSRDNKVKLGWRFSPLLSSPLLSSPLLSPLLFSFLFFFILTKS